MPETLLAAADATDNPAVPLMRSSHHGLAYRDAMPSLPTRRTAGA